MKFLVYSEHGEILDLATYLQKVCGHEVVMFIANKEYKTVGDGIVTKDNDWYRYIGEGYTWIFDSTSFGDLQDWLRGEGEAVFGGCAKGDDLENDRQLNQKWFKEAGFFQVPSHNFRTVDEAIYFVKENSDKKWILKQNGDAPKSISYLTRFEGCEDLLHHLSELKRSWNETEFGSFDCDLMEVVEGTELGASAFFNGHQFMEDNEGRVVGFIDFEEKKESDAGLGETCGEMGTAFVGVTEANALFKRILLRPALIDKLKSINFRGVFNINCILMDNENIVALEPTMRFGMPATSYELMEGMEDDPGTVIDAVARGLDKPVSLWGGVGMVMCVVAKPFPLEVDVEPLGTSVGEKLWILGRDGSPIDDFTDVQREHIHLYNFVHKITEEVEVGEGSGGGGDDKVKKTKSYNVATKNGFLLTVTRKGHNIKMVRNQLIDYISNNIFLSGMKWRSDIGKRVEEFVQEKFNEPMVSKVV